MSLLLAAAPAWATPFALQVGDVRLGFDLPAGFGDSLPTGSPRIVELAESLTPATNRILVFALSDGDMRRFNSGDPPELKQYGLIVTPKAFEFERMSTAAFERYVASGMSTIGTPPADGDFTKALEARSPGDMALLAQLVREPEVTSVIRGTRLPPAESSFFSSAKPSQYVLTSTTLILLRGKPLTLTLTAGYEGKADIEWLRTTTLRWIEDLRRLNVAR